MRAFLAWCERIDIPLALERSAVNAFVANLLDTGAEAATARARQLSLRRFSAWLADEGEIERDELLALRPPKLDQKIIERLSDDQCRAILRACAGRDLRERRDAAIRRLMLETATRAGEVVGMTLADMDLTTGRAVARRGQGGKGRIVPFGPHTARAIDRYLAAALAYANAGWYVGPIHPDDRRACTGH